MSSKKAKKQSAPKPAPVQPKSKKIFWISGAILTVFLAGTAGAGAYYVSTLPEAAFVNFYADGVELSEATSIHDAELALNEQVKNFLTSPVTFTSTRGTFTTTPEQAGVEIDVDEALMSMTLLSRDMTLLDKIRLYLFGMDLDLPLTVDETALKATFTSSGIEQGLKNASFTLSGKAVIIDPEQVGYGVDTVTLAANIQMAWLKKLSDIDLPLLTSTPTVSSEELMPLLDEATAASNAAFELTDDYGNNYELLLSDHLDWLIPGSSNIFGLQQEKFISTVQTELAPDLEEDPQGVVITQDAEGAISFEGSARFGQKIDTLALQDILETQLQTLLTTGEQPASTAIPTTRTLPEVTVPDSLKALGITDLVGVGYSDFSGSPANRVHNITEGINQFNGVLIQKDEEFSFMEHLSPVDAEHGFLPELVIKGDETIPEYGGGMCQVSSTMFRAALYSGLPITARTNHSYAVSYYARPFGYGLDATVYDPAPDLKFLNDTAGALLVQSYIDGNSAYYVFYGTNDGRRVSMDGPYVYDYRSIPADVITYVDSLAPGERELTDHGHQGFKVDWTRTITRTDGTATTETIHSNYEARPERWNEGAGAEGSEPAQS